MSKTGKEKFLIVDNSVAYTGAFHCALQQAKILQDEFDFIFVLPAGSAVKPVAEEQGICCYELPFLEISKSFNALFYYFGSLNKNAKRLQAIIEKEKAQFLQVNDFYNLIGARLKKRGYSGKLITYVRLLPSARPKILSNWWISQAVKFSDHVVCVSDAVRREMPDAKNIVRIYDAVDYPEMNCQKTSEPHTVNLLYLANYIPGKGQEYALEAFHLAYKKNERLRLHFYGGDMGLEKNRQYRKHLEKKANELGLSKVVQFFGFTTKTAEVICAADIVLNFSDAESFSMTCAEAAYYGRPVIATRCGGPEEIIENGKTGLLVNKGNIEQMADAILQLTAETRNYKVMGREAAKYVREKFSVENFIKQFLSLV